MHLQPLKVSLVFLLIIGLCSVVDTSLTAQSIDYNAIVRSEYGSNVKSAILDVDYQVDHAYHDDKLGLHFVYVQEFVEGIPVFNSITTMVLDQNGSVMKRERLIQSYKSLRSFKSSINPKDAIEIALASKGLSVNIKSSKTKSFDSSVVITDADISEEKITGERYYFPDKGQLKSVWAVAFYINEKKEWWQVIVDASNKKVIDEYPWTMTCFNHEHHEMGDYNCGYVPSIESTAHFSSCDSSYRVYQLPLSNPDEGPQTVVVTPWDLAPIASPQGWHDTTTLSGNNIVAYEDSDADNLPGLSVDGGTTLCFDVAIDTNKAPFDYVEGSLVNLFYVNNVVHDIIYNYGFDEAAGNFQKLNYNSNQGQGGDPVLAEAQDGSGINNANFSSPPDGLSGRMQMYNWAISPLKVEATINNGQAFTTLSSVQAAFGPRSGCFSGELIVADPFRGCGPFSNSSDVNGKVVLIERGDCSFATKVLHAQEAGAVGVIVCQNDANQSLFPMSTDTSAAISIPAVMISVAQCVLLTDALDTTGVSMQMDLPSYRDSDLDNGIIIHEYAHGITTRLTGGPNNSSCLDNEEQMGEGWSDWYALMLTMEGSDIATSPRGIGTYVENQLPTDVGIRRFPYSTDMNVNPLTYVDLPISFGVHEVGEVWATMLWEMTWSLIEMYDFDSDLYNGTGGNNIALQLVTTALKLQPCSPGFVDGRNAILEADELLYQGKHQCLIWEAFAKRALGFSASQGSANSRVDGLPATDLPPLCSQPFSLKRDVESHVLRQGEKTLVTIQLNSILSGASAQLEFQDYIDDNLEVILNPSGGGSYTSPYYNYSDNEFGPSSQVSLFYEVDVLDTSAVSTMVLLEDFENGALSWSASPDGWQQKDTALFGGGLMAYANDTVGDQNHFLFFPAVELKEDRIFYFQHAYDIESNWDGGFVEVSYVGDPTWYDTGEFMIEGGYDGRLIDSSNPLIANREAFTGNSTGLVETFIDLSFFTGSSIEIRFQYGSDAFVNGDGWYVDNVALLSPVYADLTASATYLGETLTDTTSILLIPACPICVSNLPCVDEDIMVSSIDLPFYKSRQAIAIDSAMMLSSTSLLSAADSITFHPETNIEPGFQLEMRIEDCDSN